MRFAIPLLALSVLAGALAPASASESRKQLGLRLDALTERVKALEERMLTGDPAAVRLQQRLDDLEAQLRTQTGASERISFENRKLREQLKSLQSAVNLLSREMQDVREQARQANAALGRYLTGDAAPARESGARAMAAIKDEQLAAAMQKSYADAKSALEQGYFDQAKAGFEAFVQRFGDQPLAGPALFWLGEINAVQGDYRAAANAYIESLKRFPKGSKAPEAMVRLGAALNAMGDKTEACRTLKAFPGRYPKASAAVRVRAKIERQRAGCP